MCPTGKDLEERLRWTPWVCWDCGVKYGKVKPRVATWHEGVCGVCGRTDAVTEPRDFGYLTPLVEPADV